MDSDRFDVLVRLVSQGTRSPSRRTLLRTAAGGAFVGLLSPAPTNAIAGKKKKPKKCKAGQKPCGAKCIPQSNCCKNAECDGTHREGCYQGKCGCGPGEIRDSRGYCGFPPNCKSVGLICATDLECCSGRCTIEDSGGQRRCDRGDRVCIVDFDCSPGLLCLGWECE
jgi:hypothetical protein